MLSFLQKSPSLQFFFFNFGIVTHMFKWFWMFKLRVDLRDFLPFNFKYKFYVYSNDWSFPGKIYFRNKLKIVNLGEKMAQNWLKMLQKKPLSLKKNGKRNSIFYYKNRPSSRIFCFNLQHTKIYLHFGWWCTRLLITENALL